MSCLMGMEYILPETEIQRITGGQRPLRMVCNAETSSRKDVEQWLEEYTQTVNPDMAFESKETYVKEFQNLQRVYVIAGGFLSGILALIGILNFINVTVTSILSRRQELAMMESIGMTGKQQMRMLQYEGLAYALWPGRRGYLHGILRCFQFCCACPYCLQSLLSCPWFATEKSVESKALWNN